MTELTVVPAIEAHAGLIAENMRAADAKECRACGFAPEAALLLSIRSSSAAYTVLADGQPVACFGICSPSLLSDEGYPWLLSHADVTRYGRPCLLISRGVVDDWKRQYRQMWGYVAQSNAISKRWLLWLGFAIDPAPVYVGADRVVFNRFQFDRVQS